MINYLKDDLMMLVEWNMFVVKLMTTGARDV